MSLESLLLLYSWCLVSGLSRSDPNTFVLPSEIQPPNYLVNTAIDGGLSQADYSVDVLSLQSRMQLNKYLSDIDELSIRLNQTLFGRAELLNPSQFDSIQCCYPEMPRTVLPENSSIAIANLSATQIFVNSP